MQFDARSRQAILDGTVTLTFRRWARRQAVPGHVYRTSVGRVAVESVDVIEPDAITADEARRAGCGSVAEVLEGLTGDPDRPLYRVSFRLVDDPDPRDQLAADADVDDRVREEIDRRLDRLDAASSHGPWTRRTLELIARHPGTRAADLAASLGRDTQPFKVDVRKLKNLGLTISLEVGYELSPRGRAYLAGRR
ncbi:MAG: hypothetical protein ACXIVQ_15875 [Acidimicrobiales bacterium]